MVLYPNISELQLYFTEDLVNFIFIFISLLFLLIVRKKDADRLKSIKLFTIIGVTNIGLVIANFIILSLPYFYALGGVTYDPSIESIASIQMGFYILANPIIQIITFGIVIAYIGYKNGPEKEGHLFIISGIFFVISIVCQILYQSSYYIYLTSYLYNYTSYNPLYLIPSFIFKFISYIYFIKYASNNSDSFRVVYGAISIFNLFLPMLIFFFEIYYISLPYYY